MTLAYVAPLTSRVKLGISVIVVPQRNGVVLAKELATLDRLCDGRLIVGVGAGWSEEEFKMLGVGDRFHHRGQYLDETLRLWNHLWTTPDTPFAVSSTTCRQWPLARVPCSRVDRQFGLAGRRRERVVGRADLVPHGTRSASAASDLAEQSTSRSPIGRSSRPGEPGDCAAAADPIRGSERSARRWADADDCQGSPR